MTTMAAIIDIYLFTFIRKSIEGCDSLLIMQQNQTTNRIVYQILIIRAPVPVVI